MFQIYAILPFIVTLLCHVFGQQATPGPQIPLEVRLGSVCQGKDDGTFVPLSHTLCLKMFLTCQNGVARVTRCNATHPFVDPVRSTCDEEARVEMCKPKVSEPVVKPPPGLDGVTVYCRHNADCKSFGECCIENCYDRNATFSCAAENRPTISPQVTAASIEQARFPYQRTEATCDCYTKAYWPRYEVTNKCIKQSPDCAVFVMCCLINGCPARYAICHGTAANGAHGNGTTAIIDHWKNRAQCYC
uniref:Chitin-binding type-2 domain-containing protein n=1 Tax=Romanomermis culicivorax TaxID=13658 RepID=A0A915J1X3_ROMCU